MCWRDYAIRLYRCGWSMGRAWEKVMAFYDAVWPIMDELMSVLQATNTRLYNGVMRKIEN